MLEHVGGTATIIIIIIIITTTTTTSIVLIINDGIIFLNQHFCFCIVLSWWHLLCWQVDNTEELVD